MLKKKKKTISQFPPMKGLLESIAKNVQSHLNMTPYLMSSFTIVIKG